MVLCASVLLEKTLETPSNSKEMSILKEINPEYSLEGLMLLNCGVGEDSWESLGCKEIQPVHPKRDQFWLFIGRTDVEAETPHTCYFGLNVVWTCWKLLSCFPEDLLNSEVWGTRRRFSCCKSHWLIQKHLLSLMTHRNWLAILSETGITEVDHSSLIQRLGFLIFILH